MDRLELAVSRLAHAAERPPAFEHAWRHVVARRLRETRDALLAERAAYDESWLAHRGSHLERERDRLAVRSATVGRLVEEADDATVAREAVRRLVTALEHHRQRVNDLAWDGVYLEVGGSE